MARVKLFIIIIAISSILAGCGTTGGGSSWPVQTYTNVCGLAMIPSEPICLTLAGYGVGFKYRDQFAACRQSISYYISALDEFYRCSDEKLKDIFDDLLKQVSETYNCYVRYFAEYKEGDPSSYCPLVEVPQFFPSYEADGLEINFGVPWCVAKSSNYNFAPKRKYQLDDCREQVEVFLNAASAQEQYDTYLRNLRWVLDQKASDAVSKFNCIGEGNKYCF